MDRRAGDQYRVSAWSDAAGAALIEALVASGLLVAVAAGGAHLLASAVRATAAARFDTVATILAAQKLEQLQSLTWSVAADGAPVSDESADLSVDPAAGGDPGLSLSPAGALNRNTPPYVDYLDSAGQWAGNGASPPGSAMYVRRWSITALPEDADARVLQVLVTTSRDATVSASGAGPVSVRLVSLKIRKR